MQAHPLMTHRAPGLAAPGDLVTQAPMTPDEAFQTILANKIGPAITQAALEAMVLISFVLTNYGTGFPGEQTGADGRPFVQLYEDAVPTNNWGFIPCIDPASDSCDPGHSGYSYTLQKYASEEAGVAAFLDAFQQGSPSLADLSLNLDDVINNFYSLALSQSGISSGAFGNTMRSAYDQWALLGHVMQLPLSAALPSQACPPGQVPDGSGGCKLDTGVVVQGPASTLQVAQALETYWTKRDGIKDAAQFSQGLLGWAAVASNNGFLGGVQTLNPGHLGLPSGADGSCVEGTLKDPNFALCVILYSDIAQGILAWQDYVMANAGFVDVLNSGDTGQLAAALIGAGVFQPGMDMRTNWAVLSSALQAAIDRAVADIAASGAQGYTSKWALSTWQPDEVKNGPPVVPCGTAQKRDLVSGQCVDANAPLVAEAKPGMSTTTKVIIGAGVVGAVAVGAYAWNASQKPKRRR